MHYRAVKSNRMSLLPGGCQTTRHSYMTELTAECRKYDARGPGAAGEVFPYSRLGYGPDDMSVSCYQEAKATGRTI